MNLFMLPNDLKNYSQQYKYGPILDWPIYDRVKEIREEISELKANYAAFVTMVDEYFGKLLDWCVGFIHLRS